MSILKLCLLCAIFLTAITATSFEGDPVTGPFSRVTADLSIYDQTLAGMESNAHLDPANPSDKNWVKKKLKQMFNIDQYMRFFEMDTPKDHAYSNDEISFFRTTFLPRGESLDRQNTADLKNILKSYDWIKISEFGKEADTQAWLIVQHADLDLAWQIEILKILERLWPLGETNPSSYAYLFDRVAVAGRDPTKQKPQRYGTQGGCEGAEWKPEAIEDASHLNDRRKQMGLSSEEDYIKQISAFCK